MCRIYDIRILHIPAYHTTVLQDSAAVHCFSTELLNFVISVRKSSLANDYKVESLVGETKQTKLKAFGTYLLIFSRF
jgi:hypothetical protein